MLETSYMKKPCNILCSIFLLFQFKIALNKGILS